MERLTRRDATVLMIGGILGAVARGTLSPATPGSPEPLPDDDKVSRELFSNRIPVINDGAFAPTS